MKEKIRVKTNNLIHRCVHLSFEKSYRIIMNRSPQFDVYFHAKNASGTPNYPGTYPMYQHGTIPSHRTQKWRASAFESTHSSLFCNTRRVQSREQE
jgi:hypothetical protein